MKIIITNNTKPIIPTEFVYYPSLNKTSEETCLHKTCQECNGTGTKKNGMGYCWHMIACPCPKCSPTC